MQEIEQNAMLDSTKQAQNIYIHLYRHWRVQENIASCMERDTKSCTAKYKMVHSLEKTWTWLESIAAAKRGAIMCNVLHYVHLHCSKFLYRHFSSSHIRAIFSAVANIWEEKPSPQLWCFTPRLQSRRTTNWCCIAIVRTGKRAPMIDLH